MNYEAINENMGRRSALNEAMVVVSARQSRCIDEILALDLDDPDFIQKHDVLNGKYDVLTELYCKYSAMITALVDESTVLWQEA